MAGQLLRRPLLGTHPARGGPVGSDGEPTAPPIGVSLRPLGPLTDGVVTLRPFTPADATAVTEACQDPEIPHWTLAVPSPYTETHARAWIGLHGAAFAEAREANLAVTAADGGDLVGSISLIRLNWDLGTGRIGYWVAAPSRRRGYASRALLLVSDWAFGTLGLLTLELLTVVGNVASEGVATATDYLTSGRIDQIVPPGGPPPVPVRRWLRSVGSDPG